MHSVVWDVEVTHYFHGSEFKLLIVKNVVIKLHMLNKKIKQHSSCAAPDKTQQLHIFLFLIRMHFEQKKCKMFRRL